MALYIPASRRRRNATFVAVATLLAGLAIGFLAGRSSATTASEAARDVRSKGDTLGTRIEALEIEYDQAINATAGSDTVKGGVLDALDLVAADTDRLIGSAPWIGPGQTAVLHAAIDAVRTAADKRVSSVDFATVATTTAVTMRNIFGVEA